MCEDYLRANVGTTGKWNQRIQGIVLRSGKLTVNINIIKNRTFQYLLDNVSRYKS